MKTPRISLPPVIRHPAFGLLPFLLVIFLFLFPGSAMVLIPILLGWLAFIVLKKKVREFLDDYDGK